MPQNYNLPTLGSGLPEVAQMLQQKQQMDMRNALAQQQNDREAAQFGMQQRQFDEQRAQQANALTLRQKLSEMAGISGLGPQAKAEYVRRQAQEHPDFAQSPFAQMPPDQAFDAMYRQAETMVTGKAPERPAQRDILAEQKFAWEKQKFEREQALEREKLKRSDGGPGLGKPPPGYRWNPDGSLGAIPGGPADIKATADAEKARRRAENAATSADMLISEIDDAIGLVGRPTAGTGSATAKKLGYEPAVNLASKLETVKANLGFDRLQQMRESSPTGGALGAVAVQELFSLQSTVASLDQAQSPEQLKKALNKIKYHYNRWSNVMRQAGNDGGGYLDRTAPSTGGGGVVDFGSLK